MRNQAFPVAALNTIYATNIAADGYKICQGAQCGDCPVSTSSEGLGYPDGTIYNSADLFTGREWDVWFDLSAQEDPECYWVVRSPASQGVDNCGLPKYVGQDHACRNIQLKETFMLQFCCGDDCCSAGVPNEPNFSPKKREMMMRNPFELRNSNGSHKSYARSGGGGSLLLYDKDGSLIEPMAQGLPINAKSPSSSTSSYASENTQGAANKLESRGRCTANSWVDNGEEYMTTGDNTQVVSDVVGGGATAKIGQTRTSSWSTTMESSLGFGDILGMGISFSVTETQEISTTKEYEFPVPDGPDGYVVFTPYVRCKKGSGKCDGNDVSGTVCMPFTNSVGGPAGEYSVVQWLRKGVLEGFGVVGLGL